MTINKDGGEWVVLMDRAAENGDLSCIWREDADGNWHTGCGHIFCFDDGGPEKNGFKFCGYCGSDLKEEPYGEAEESE